MSDRISIFIIFHEITRANSVGSASFNIIPNDTHSWQCCLMNAMFALWTITPLERYYDDCNESDQQETAENSGSDNPRIKTFRCNWRRWLCTWTTRPWWFSGWPTWRLTAWRTWRRLTVWSFNC